MKNGTNLFRRNGSANWQARLAEPVELHNLRVAAGLPSTPKRVRAVSLKTSDQREAHRRRDAALRSMRAQFDQEIATLKQRIADTEAGEPARTKPTTADLESAVFAFVRDELALDHRMRATVGEPTELEREARQPFIQDLQAQRHGLPELRGEQGEEESESEAQRRRWPLVAWAVDHIIASRRFDVAPGSDEWETLARLATRGLVQITKDQARRDASDYAQTANDPMFDPPTPAQITGRPAATPDPGHSIEGLLESHVKSVGAELSSEEIAKRRRVVPLFADFFGPTRSIREATKQDARRWQEALEHWPYNAGNFAHLRGKRFATIVEISKRDGMKPISRKTLNDYVGTLSSFFGWAERKGYIDDGAIFRGIGDKIGAKAKRAAKREPFTPDQLRAIFAAPVFTGCQ